MNLNLFILKTHGLPTYRGHLEQNLAGLIKKLSWYIVATVNELWNYYRCYKQPLKIMVLNYF